MTSLILLAGGLAKKSKTELPKQFLTVGGKPIFINTLEVVDKLKGIQEVLITSHISYVYDTIRYIEKSGFSKKYSVIEDGNTRQESVFKALKLAKGDSVVIHEASRPFVTENDFVRLLNAPGENVTYGSKIPYTVLGGGEGYITRYLHRDALIHVQSPQKFVTSMLLDAHSRAAEEGRFFTDDSSLLYYYTKTRIDVLPGSEYNIKVSEPIDLVVGQILYNEYVKR